MASDDSINQMLALIEDISVKLSEIPASQQAGIAADLQKLKDCTGDLQQSSIVTHVNKQQTEQSARTQAELQESALQEAALQEAAARLAWLASIPDENPNPVIRASVDGKVLYINLAAAQQEGWPSLEGEFLGGELRALLDQMEWQTRVQDVILDSREYTVYLIPNVTEQYINIFGVDVTERKWLERELRASEANLLESQRILQEANERFRTMADGTPVMIWVHNAEGKIDFVNRAHLDFFGATLEEVRSGGWQALVHPDDTARYVNVFAECLRERRPFRAQARVRRCDGAWRWVDSHGQPRFSETGEFLGMVGSSLDITERVEMEEALKASEERARVRANELEALMDAFPALVWISRDPQCREMIGNHYGYEFLQLGPGANLSKTAPEDELSVQPYTNLKDGKAIPPEELPMQIAASTGKPARDYTFDVQFQDGSLYNLLGNVNPLFDQDGKPSGAVGVFIDISRVRKLEAERVDAIAQIEVQRRLMDLREQERQGIARDIHDGPVQTLASLGFNIQVIKEAYSDPSLNVELEQVAYTIKNAVRELRDIIKDLRPPSIIRFGLARAIRMHVEDVQERHPELNFTLVLAEDGGVLSDQACLTLFRIFQEGLNNVIRHAKATRVAIRYQTTESDFSLELQDNGQGFSIQKDASQVFSEGHFGLVGMKERAQAIGGEFSVVSAPDQGTTITVSGPLLGKNVK